MEKRQLTLKPEDMRDYIRVKGDYDDSIYLTII